MPLNVLRATSSGYCFGVRDAVDMALQAAQRSAEDGARLYAYGPIIHNDHVVQRLQEQGVTVVDRLDQIAPAGEGEPAPRVIIRAHGITKEDLRYANDHGFEMVDATCPLVTRPQQLAQQVSEEGYAVVLVGNQDHPEIRGILSYIDGPKAVARGEGDLPDWPPTRRVALLPQTTLQREELAKITQEAVMRFQEVRVINTICRATRDRQDAAGALAPTVDVMVVIGGKRSANTRHLADICRDAGARTYQIADPSEVDALDLSGARSVGVTGGASTPDDLIEATIERVRARGLHIAT